LIHGHLFASGAFTRGNGLNTIWLDLSLAYRNIVRQRRRSAVAIGAISFGITALIVASGFIEWIFMDFRESTINAQLGHLQIVKPGYHDSGKADPYAFLLPNEVPQLGDAGNAGAITLLISHRFSTVRMADLIVVLDGARLVEVGTHDELMAKRGQYSELYNIQAAAYR
jgi:hypothetical protein